MTGNTLLPVEIESEEEYEELVGRNGSGEWIGKELRRWSSGKHMDMLEEKLMLLL